MIKKKLKNNKQNHKETHKCKMITTSIIFTILFLILNNKIIHSQDTIKIMTYNLLNFTESSINRVDYFKTVIDYVNPDVLVVQEMLSQQSLNIFQINVLNESYSSGLFIDGFDSDNAIFYRNDLFSFIDNKPIQTELRDINQFTAIQQLF